MLMLFKFLNLILKKPIKHLNCFEKNNILASIFWPYFWPSRTSFTNNYQLFNKLKNTDIKRSVINQIPSNFQELINTVSKTQTLQNKTNNCKCCFGNISEVSLLRGKPFFIFIGNRHSTAKAKETIQNLLQVK